MRIRLLGGLEVVSPRGEPVRFATRKTALLFAALTLAGRRGVRRETLCDLFWPGRGEAQARNSLRQALADIRRLFPPGNGAAIHVEADLETAALVADVADGDVWLFDQLIQRGDPASLALAADLYQGDLLDGVALPEPLDQWFAPHRSAYRRKALELVDLLSRAYPAIGTTEELACERLAERLVASDPTAEEAHRALIRLYLNRGKANAALRQFRSFKEALQRELGVEPEDETRALIEEQRENGERPGQPTPPPAVEAPIASAQRDTDHPSVVVLPFENLSGPDDEYLVDGVVEEITAMLSRVRSFFVIARQSAFAYKGRRVDVREIGREFGVSYAVEGTVRRAGDRVRIFVQLADTGTRAQLWSERFDRAASDIFELEDEIAARVAGAVRPALLYAEIEAARRKPPGSLRSYELVLTAYPKIWSATAEGNRQAIALLREAIAIDPDYGRAHALLAWCHAQDVDYLWSSDPEADRALTLAAIAAASRLVSNDPMALTALAAAVLQCLADPDRAAAYVEEALWLDPNNAWAWGRSGWIAVYRDQPRNGQGEFRAGAHAQSARPAGTQLQDGHCMGHRAGGRLCPGGQADAARAGQEPARNMGLFRACGLFGAGWGSGDCT